MEQLESRALGKPKESVENVGGEAPAQRMLRQMSDEDLEAFIRSGLPLGAVDDEEQEAV
jgi:hypothetical protein